MRFLAVSLFALGACATAPPSLPPPSLVCHASVWRLDDGRLLDVGPALDGLRWRMAEGTTGLMSGDGPKRQSTLGWTGRADGHDVELGACGENKIRFDGQSGERISLVTLDTTFKSGGETLRGRLVLPEGDAAATVVVQVHGSERTSAVAYNSRQRMLPAEGVGVFVYDKRGTGLSTGAYTQDFSVLAADASAAAREARRLGGGRISALVYEGGSQGGWVAPLAATIEPADAIIVGYGLTVSPLAENRSQVLEEMQSLGFDGDALKGAAELADATGEVMASGFSTGFDKLAAAKAKHEHEPWYGHVKGEFTGEILGYPSWALQLSGPIANWMTNQGTPWRHEPLPVLRQLDIPILWVLAGADREAPPEQTRRDLMALQAEGRAITILEFPDTDHGIVEFETGPDGSRVRTRIADGYFDAVTDFARQRALANRAYGKAVRIDPRAWLSPTASSE